MRKSVLSHAGRRTVAKLSIRARQAAIRLFLCALCMAGFGGVARGAAELPSQQVGYVDLIEVQNKSIPLQKLVNTTNKRIEPKRDESLKKLKEYDALKARSLQGAVLKDAERAEIVARMKKLEKEIETLKDEIQTMLNSSLDTTTSSSADLILAATEKVARAKGFAVVLWRDVVLWGHPAQDLTQDVIAQLNKGAEASATGASRSNSRSTTPR